MNVTGISYGMENEFNAFSSSIIDISQLQGLIFNRFISYPGYLAQLAT